ncbi:MAG: hypothetical protein K940chlam2_01312 [Chlamydiae bacterium]|nr:hypothetical protein [Chlamydiota bacterium]
MGSEKKLRSIGVHDGTFHADEVVACALLILFDLADAVRVVRTRDAPKLAECEYVCDVGGVYDPAKKLFDHHQTQYTGELSSAGMILYYLKEKKILGADGFAFLHNTLVKGVDDHDNGRSPQLLGYFTFSHVIANLTPVSYEATEEQQREAFFEALDFTVGILRRLWERYQYNVGCRKIVGEVMKKYHTCLFFERGVPWLESFFALGGEKHSALFLIMPAGSQWKLRGLPPDYVRRMEVRQPLPKLWAGLLGEELKRVSGIKGAVFCHKGLFTSVWETKEDAIKALEIVLKQNGIKNEDII